MNIRRSTHSTHDDDKYYKRSSSSRSLASKAARPLGIIVILFLAGSLYVLTRSSPSSLPKEEPASTSSSSPETTSAQNSAIPSSSPSSKSASVASDLPTKALKTLKEAATESDTAIDDIFGLFRNTKISERSVRLPHPRSSSSNSAASNGKNTNLKNSRRYSRFRCVGDDNRVEAHQERICVFENMCYRMSTGVYEFYQPKEGPTSPILYDSKRGERHSFEDDGHGFVALWQTLDIFQATKENSFAPVIVKGVSPAAASGSENPEGVNSRIIMEKFHVLYSHWAPDDNLGHFLWEELGGIYYAMLRLNIYSDDFIPMHGLYQLSDRPRAKAFREAFVPALTKSEVVDMRAYFQNLTETTKQEKQLNKDIDYICFDQLMVGGNMRRFVHYMSWHNQGHEPMFYGFRNRILKRNGLPLNQLPEEHRIVITNKTVSDWIFKEGVSRVRGIYNLQEVVDYVKAQYKNVKVDVVEWQKLDIKAQLALMQSTTLFITCPGGVSMLLPFLPEGAHAIITDYLENFEYWHGTHPGESTSMEAPFWNHWPHVKKNYYQVFNKEELMPNDPRRSLDDNDLMWRDETSVVVDVNRLGKMIDAAFAEMEP
ncbi:hypothetical protein HDV05_001643 [Chytridiales sp. JEL 0842]|nr:hypothetical protein HDV05_001643 [Chytridiales sp. JEL 0842]